MKQKKLLMLIAMVLVVVLCASVLTACKKDKGPGKDYSATTHTYYAAMAQSPSTWNPHQAQSTYDSMPLDYTENGFYEFAYNETMDGYVLAPVMAAADPVDVSSQYVGEAWEIKEGETGKAFRIALNRDAKWQNGEAITADDYLYSMKALLDPRLANYRASNFYSGSYVIHNAKNYVYSGQKIMVSDDKLEDADSIKGKDLYINAKLQSYLLKEVSSSFEDCDSIDALYNDYFVATYVEMANTAWESGELQTGKINETRNFKTKEEYANVDEYTKDFIEYKMSGEGSNAFRQALNDLYQYLTNKDAPIEKEGTAKGFIKVTGNEKLIGLLKAFSNALFSDESLYTLLVAYIGEYPVTTFDQVGVQKIDDYTIDIIVDNELVGFYIKYTLSTNWLVYKDIYENCIKQDPKTGAWSCNYGTAIDRYMAYGPYKITKFIDGQQMVFEKNENWFGFTEKYADTYGTFVRGIDGKTCKQYETDKIVMTQAKDLSTREQMFLKGQLDSLGLDVDLLAKYKSSDALYFTEGESTFYGIMCSDFDKLKAREDVAKAEGKKINKTILAIPEFRQALCYGIDRTALCAALYPAGTPAFGIFSNAVMADPENSVSYRSLDTSKEALVSFWGIEYGEGKEFKTLDEAYEAITGYNLKKARELVDIAYDKAIKSNWMTADDIVSIEYCSSEESDTEVKWYNTFKANFAKLMEGTKLQGKFEYTANYTLGNKFGEKIRNGDCDTAWGFGWNGGTLDPFDLFQVYVDAALGGNYQYDAWVDWSEVELELTLKYDYDTKEATEKTYKHSVAEWAGLLYGQKDVCDSINQKWTFGNVPDAIRAQVLAKLEEALLKNYTTIPLMNEGGVSLKSYKINFGQENYIYGLGRGGVRFITYNYTDGEWAKYCDSQASGILTY